MSRPRRNDESGFTLLELIITVAIIAILAAIAIPMLQNYTKKSKASEAFEVLQGIREKENSYYATFRQYTNNIGWHPRGNPALATGDTVQWPGTAAWRELGFTPSGPVYYDYRVTTDMGGAAPVNGLGTTWPAAPGAWFQVEGAGDIDNNGQLGNFHISSRNNKVFHEQYDDLQY